jgi:hypothetical protein
LRGEEDRERELDRQKWNPLSISKIPVRGAIRRYLKIMRSLDLGQRLKRY